MTAFPRTSPCRLVAVLGAAAVSTACGSNPLDGRADEPAGGARPDREVAGVGTAEACRSLDEVRRLGERYDEVADERVFDAVRTAEDDPDVARDESALQALHEMVIELDPLAVDLLAAYRDAADAAPAVADELEFLADFTEVTVESWQQLRERPDADPRPLLDAIDDRDEAELFEAWVAVERVEEFTSDECGFGFVPDE